MNECLICQHQKHNAKPATGLLQPLPTTTTVGEDISFDFIEGLPRSQGVESIWVVVGHLSKYAHFRTLQHLLSAMELRKLASQIVTRVYLFFVGRMFQTTEHYCKDVFSLSPREGWANGSSQQKRGSLFKMVSVRTAHAVGIDG